MNSLKIIFDRDTWQEIFGSISKNKTRTIITVIGVLWGIFIYITLSGAAKGLDNGFERAFKNIAKNSMGFWAQRTSIPYDGFKVGRQPVMKLEDVKYLKDRVSGIQYISPTNSLGAFGGTAPTISRKNFSESYALYGIYPVYNKITSKKVFDGGRFINDQDILEERKICVIGERTASELYEKDENPVGSYVQINSVYFQVVGVHKFNQGGFESEGDVFIPFTTFNKLFNRADRVDFMFLAAYDQENPVAIEEEILTTLKRLKRVAPEDERAFGTFNIGEAFGRIMGFANGMTFLSIVVGIATILAGVIGIGNILLISVKERTKELGVRRALGATPGEVRSQIILESVFLTTMAGIIGIVLASFILAGINAGTANLEDFPYTNPTVPISFVLGALVIMVSLGSLIGLIPAQRAVSIKPIDALREE
ncbi:MAG: ABC transporter permease [Flavobacteriaceae bacterium]